MIWTIIIGYILFQIALVSIIFLVTNKTDKKSKKRNIPKNEVPIGFEPTSESFIDSHTKKVVTVYYNKTTGKRMYVESD